MKITQCAAGATQLWRWFVRAPAAAAFLLLFFIPPLPAQELPQPGALVVGDRVVLTLRAPVGSVSPVERAAIVNARIADILRNPGQDPAAVEARELAGGDYLLALGAQPLLQITQADADVEGQTREAVAEEWSRRLRQALMAAKPLQPPAGESGHRVSFLPLLLVSVLAFLIPLAVSRFKRFPIPIVVGEILVGILIGQSGLRLVHYDSWLQFLAEFGFAFLMFLSGLEVDFDLLAASRNPEGGSRPRRNPVTLALLVFALTLLLAGLLSLALAAAGLIRHPWMMMLVLSTTSLGMVVPVLKERNLTATPFGQTLLLAALVADFVTMFLITIVAGWIASGPTLEVFLSLVLIGAFLAAFRLARRIHRATGIQRVLEDLAHATTQLQVRGSLALMLVFVALSEQLGTEIILGAFLAGVLLSLLARADGADLRHKLEAFGFGFFIPIFFIMVGVRFDLQALVSSREGLLLAGLLVAGAFVIKIGAAQPFRQVATPRETWAAGFLLSSRLSLIIAAAEIGMRLGLFSRTVHAAAVCVALVTCVGGPLGFQFLMPASTRRKRRVLVAGTGDYGRLLAERLAAQGWEASLVDPEAPEAASPSAYRVVSGPAADEAVLRRAGVGEAAVVVTTFTSDPANEEVAAAALALGAPRVLALCRKGETAERLRGRGVVPVNPTLATLLTLEGLVTHPAVFNVLTERTAGKRIAEARLTNPELFGKTLQEVRWPGDVLVLTVQREEDLLVPEGSTRLREGDVVALLGAEEAVEAALARIKTDLL